MEAELLFPQTNSDCARLVKDVQSCIPRGQGRSYGDSANAAEVLQSTYLNHYIQFDTGSGLLTCEAGVTIREVLDLIVPRAWFIPVTPGSSYVSIGGAIASDVHGKNHHGSGTFSQHVIEMQMMLASGEIVTVSRSQLPDLFAATCGGMGLTGMILSATLQLMPIQSSQIEQKTMQASCLEAVCAGFEENTGSTYSVAWIDCIATGPKLGRSLLMLGEHAVTGGLEVAPQKPLNVPVDAPDLLLNQQFIKLFNTLYYQKARLHPPEQRLSYNSYFYPLDQIANWNRLYGKAGFIQYQFVLPSAAGVQGLRSILQTIAASGKGSFLAVLKAFGEHNANYLSFPMAGYTLALDFKVSPEVIALVQRLDAMVMDMGGRIYLSKDALMSEATFKATYLQWEQFEAVRAKYGAIGKFGSQQSKRLGLQ
jgi:FAD/FMN-containing dehydrogenase